MTADEPAPDKPADGDAGSLPLTRTRRYVGEDHERDDVSADDRDLGWGEATSADRGEEWYRRERPPHHG